MSLPTPPACPVGSVHRLEPTTTFSNPVGRFDLFLPDPDPIFGKILDTNSTGFGKLIFFIHLKNAGNNDDVRKVPVPGTGS
jgi:hypothetical protein